MLVKTSFLEISVEEITSEVDDLVIGVPPVTSRPEKVPAPEKK